MELQIQDLVASIKHDGIEEANKQKEAIINQGKQEAKRLIDEAKAESKKIINLAQKESAIEKESSVAAVKQASRDLVLSLKIELNKIFGNLLSKECEKVFDSEALATLILAAIKEEEPGKYELEVKKVTQGLKNSLSKEISNGLVLKTLGSGDGFKILEKDGSGYFDFTEEQVVKMLKPYLGKLVL